MIELNIPGLTLYRQSVVQHEGTTYFIGRKQADATRCLGVIGHADQFQGIKQAGVLLGPLSPENAAAIRDRLPWLKPVPLGQQTSFGFGDRLGSATPGHIQAMRAVVKKKPLAPIFAQQSVRENSRIGRTPQQVVDDALWGILQQGWQTAWGADADHVKEIAQLPDFVQAGYTFYTIDPSDHVDNEAQSDSPDTLRRKVGSLPWADLETTYGALRQDYCRSPLQLAQLTLSFDEETLLRALAKYGRAISHTLAIAAVLNKQMAGQTYDLEMSVDETDTPTSIHEHFFIANELLKREVPVVSLAPRFVGKFQKGVDYMGDLALFETELVKHAAIRHHFDRYKISVHTGSDKFTIYPVVAKHTANRVHVKTAGTSYLEILRVIASHKSEFFRSILDFSRTRFETDRKSYYVDCQPAKVPATATLTDADLPDLLEQFDARQLLHVTFGSVLDKFSREIHAFADTHERDYQAALEKHFIRHLLPFT